MILAEVVTVLQPRIQIPSFLEPGEFHGIERGAKYGGISLILDTKYCFTVFHKGEEHVAFIVLPALFIQRPVKVMN